MAVRHTAGKQTVAKLFAHLAEVTNRGRAQMSDTPPALLGLYAPARCACAIALAVWSGHCWRMVVPVRTPALVAL
jgi:hypothetical protein